MRLMDKFIKKAAAPSPGTEVEFVRSYKNMKSFRGTKRIHLTTYGDKENADKNALALLGDKDKHMCVGSEITLTGFRYNLQYGLNTAIKVAVDGNHVGIIWSEDHPLYPALYSGSVAGVYVLIEKGADFTVDLSTGEEGGPRANVYLFVKTSDKA